ncbi:MAG: RNA polymerase sigma factor [Fimbriiglobus sp.]
MATNDERDPSHHLSNLYEQHAREVWAIAYSRRLDRDLALDIVHEVFLRLWQQKDHGLAIEHPRAWLMQVARNLAEDYSKSSFRRHGTQAPETLFFASGKDVLPLDKMEKAELFSQVRALLQELSTNDRDILTMRYALDWDVPSIAESLGVPISSVHMRLSRARQRLADKLSIHGVNSAS